MGDTSYDIEGMTEITHMDGRRETVPGVQRIVSRRGSRGRFATKREAEEYIRGRVLYSGRYRTREEIKDIIANTPAWRGAACQRLQTGWRFIHYTGAELFLRAA